jgi:hypothetical protein
MMKHKLTAALLALAIATPAFAQQMNKPDTAQTTKPDTAMQSSTASPGNFVLAQDATDSRGSKLIGATVYGPGNASIGEVNDVLIANDGKIKAVVIGVGGFLGIGEKNVAVPFDQLDIAHKSGSAAIDKITVSFTKEELKSAPKFAYADTPASATTGSSMTDRIKTMNPMGTTSKDK